MILFLALAILAALLLTSRSFWLAIGFVFLISTLGLADWFGSLSFTTILAGAFGLGIVIGVLKMIGEAEQKRRREEIQRQKFREDIELAIRKSSN